MKILYIIPTYYSKEFLPYAFPLGPAYIMASLKKSNFEVRCLNLNYETTPLSILLKKIYSEYQFDVVITGGLSTDYNKIKQIRNIVKNFKKDTIFIVGGGLVTSMPELILENIKPDFISIGEGEYNICKILEKLQNNDNNFREIKGIGYVTNGELVVTQPETIKNIDSLPFPDFELAYIDAFLKNQKFFLKNDSIIMPIISSRGCPFKCTFCFHTVGDKYRNRTLDNFFQELEYLIDNYGINTFIIYDELLSANKERLFLFCQRISEYNVRWSCQMRVDIVTEEILKIMRASGCFAINYGIESICDNILSSMKKNINRIQIENALFLTKKNGISIQGNLIFGDKKETFNTALETLNWWKKHNYYCLNLSLIIPYPGTEAFKYCIKEGIINNSLEYLEKNCPVVNMTKMDKETYENFLGLMSDTFKKYKFSGKILENNGKTIKYKCPHCGNISEYNDVDILGKILCQNCNQWSWK